MTRLRIASMLLDYRREKGMSQNELGVLLGVSAQAVSKWEREICYPDVILLPDLAKILGVSVGELFEEL
ncbi:MAG: helix-turn-helix transcriptional regulator [Clostridia bacterium]|nr:helix-turn-helix transcriptional regulator [Clostridia bacterium]